MSTLLLAALLGACGGGGGSKGTEPNQGTEVTPPTPASTSPEVAVEVTPVTPSEPEPALIATQKQLSSLEAELRAFLDAWESDTDFTLMLETETGYQFTHSTGTSTQFTPYESASTSKLVVGAIFSRLVQKGLIDLDARPQMYLPDWPQSGPLSEITLAHLLSFTSGITATPGCVHDPNTSLEHCVSRILELNKHTKYAPGEVFDYNLAAMQVAAQMAAVGSGYGSWQAIFEAFQMETGLFANASFSLPSAINPRLAAGMIWNAAEYMEFLGAITRDTLLDTEHLSLLLKDRTSSMQIKYSPAVNSFKQNWHYGLGVWLECDGRQYDCEAATRYSSPGAYGAYPFIDLDQNYFGIIAKQGDLSAFITGRALFVAIEPKITRWAELATRLSPAAANGEADTVSRTEVKTTTESLPRVDGFGSVEVSTVEISGRL